MPFYETGTVKKRPLGDEDIQIVVNLLRGAVLAVLAVTIVTDAVNVVIVLVAIKRQRAARAGPEERAVFRRGGDHRRQHLVDEELHVIRAPIAVLGGKVMSAEKGRHEKHAELDYDAQ